MRDTNEKRGPATTPDPAYATEPSVAAAGTDRRPGEWPSVTALREKWRREHARRTWAFGAIREHLAQQPTPSSIRNVARLWCRDITAAADVLAQALQDQEHHQ
ncbi:hypothetical protein B1R27_30120 [Streptomyces sp. GKU 895]|nr:hypothetical protein B1R27_30120 [Streptomyces sp. GKU 895]